MSQQLARLEALFWRTARGELQPDAVLSAFTGSSELDPLARMAIYRDMYFERQIRALSECYPRVLSELGPDAFHEHGWRYVLSHPSRAPVLEWFGRDFPAFLARARVPASVVDFARLEWLSCAALLSPPKATPEAPLLQPDAWPRARLSFQASLHTLRVSGLSFRRFLGSPEPAPDSVSVAVFRPRAHVRFLELAEDEGAALRGALSGLPFGDVCACFEDTSRAFDVLRHWFARGWVIRVLGDDP